MTGKLHLHNHYNGLKTAVLFAIMWAIIMIIWWATGARTSTLGIYLAIGVGTSFISYWFSDKLAIASMHAQPVTEQQAPELYRIVRELSQRAGKPMPRIYIAPTVEQENHSPLRFKRLGKPGGQFCIKRRREVANNQPYHPALPTAQRRRLAITHKAQLLNGLVDALTRSRRDAPLPAQYQRNGANGNPRRQRDIVDGDLFRYSHVVA